MDTFWYRLDFFFSLLPPNLPRKLPENFLTSSFYPVIESEGSYGSGGACSVRGVFICIYHNSGSIKTKKNTRAVSPDSLLVTNQSVYAKTSKIKSGYKGKTIMWLFDMKMYDSSQVCSAAFASRSLFHGWHNMTMIALDTRSLCSV